MLPQLVLTREEVRHRSSLAASQSAISLPRAKSQPAGYRQLFLPFFFFLNKKKGVPKGSGLLDIIRRITGDSAGRAAVKGGSGYVVKGSTDRTDVIFRKAPAPKLTCSRR